MADDTELAVLGALEGAFGDTPKAPAAPKPAPVAKAAPVPEPAEETAPAEDEPLPVDEDGEVNVDQLLDGEPEEPAITEPDPEFEVEVNGQKEIVRGKEKVTELLQKGLHYSRGSEEVARVREQLMAQAQMQQQQTAFQQAAFADISALQALDAQLEQFAKIDWATAIDSDFVGVMKLQEQRSALREAKNAKLAELNQKQQQFQQGQAEAAQRMLVAEESALLAKLPAWRNSETAKAEKTAISSALATRYGFQASELQNIMDHRMILVARDAMKWQELQRNKTEKVKQLRDAPPVAKPGAAATQADPHSKAGFAKFTQELKRQGRAGNHRAQEELLTKAFSRTFK